MYKINAFTFKILNCIYNVDLLTKHQLLRTPPKFSNSDLHFKRLIIIFALNNLVKKWYVTCFYAYIETTNKYIPRIYLRGRLPRLDQITAPFQLRRSWFWSFMKISHTLQMVKITLKFHTLSRHQYTNSLVITQLCPSIQHRNSWLRCFMK